MLSESWSKSSYSAHNGNCVQVAFRKSSHSASNGHCVEVGWGKSSHSMANGECAEVGYRKSSHSHSDGNCVEVADGCGQVHVRDSKNLDGPVLGFSPGAWMEFLGALKEDGPFSPPARG